MYEWTVTYPANHYMEEAKRLDRIMRWYEQRGLTDTPEYDYVFDKWVIAADNARKFEEGLI